MTLFVYLFIDLYIYLYIFDASLYCIHLFLVSIDQLEKGHIYLNLISRNLTFRGLEEYYAFHHTFLTSNLTFGPTIGFS